MSASFSLTSLVEYDHSWGLVSILQVQSLRETECLPSHVERISDSARQPSLNSLPVALGAGSCSRKVIAEMLVPYVRADNPVVAINSKVWVFSFFLS